MADNAVEAKLKEGGRRVEEVAARSLGHRIRVEILAALHEGPASASELARIVRQPSSRVWNHIKNLLEEGSIEEANTERRGNHIIVSYAVVRLPFVTEKEAAEMTAEERQVHAALTLQHWTAEALAALWAGKMHSDLKVWAAWQPLVLDERAREDLAVEQQRSWDRMQEIAVEATNRRAETGDAGKTIVVSSFSFERHRKTPNDPLDERLIEGPRKS